MSSITYISKQWTVDRFIGLLRTLVNQLAPDKVQTLPLIDYLNLASLEFSQALDEKTKKEDYGKSFSILNSATGGNVELVADSPGTLLTAYANINASADATKLRIDTITGISYTPTAGTPQSAIKVSPLEFENLLAIPQRDEEIYYYQFGEVLYFLNRIGTITLEADWGTINVFYNRYPVKLSAASADRLGDTLDVRDAFVETVLAMAKVYVYEELEQMPPESLLGTITNAIAGLKDSLNVESSFVNDYAKKYKS
jgi:hypothetical protein